MTKEDILAQFDEAEYQRACSEARRSAADPNYGGREDGSGFYSDFPDELSDEIWSADLAPCDRISLFFAFYDDMPCYGHLMYAKFDYKDLPISNRREFWRQFRERLGSDDPALRHPLEYSLWCDFFEDRNTVSEAWEALVTSDSPPRILRSVLKYSGPVPYDLKRALYDRLLPQSEWHPYIFQSLLHSHFDYFGKLNRSDARQLLGQLTLPEDTEHLQSLRKALEAGTLR